MSSPVSDSLFERAKQLIPGGVNSPVRAFRSVGGAPFFVKAARGATLITADGRELIDFVCTWGPAIHGHNHPRIKAAIAAALENGTSFGTPNPSEVSMAELIVKFFPSIQKVRMCNSGTEATMSAIRLARGFTKRDKIIKFAGCYHGHSDSLLIKAGSGALTHGNPDSAGVPASFARETVVLPYNDRGALEAAFAANPGQIACVILEAYCGNVGFIMPDPGYLAFVREITARHGTVLIFDEVMTGFGRTGAAFACVKAQVLPDMICLSKGLTGGFLPLSMTVTRDAIFDAFLGQDLSRAFLHGHSYTANPLGCAAGLASLDLLQGSACQARIAEIETLHRHRLDRLMGKSGISRTRLTGTIAAFDVDGGGEGYGADIGNRLKAAFLERGLLLRPLGNVIYMLPPYCITDDELHRAWDAVEAVLGQTA